MKKNIKNVKHNKKIDNRKNIDLKSQLKKVEVGIQNGIFIYVEPLTIDEFSKKINKSASEIIKYLFLKGVACNLNTVLTEEQMGEICIELGYDFKKEIQINEDNLLDQMIIEDDEANLEKRAPIITIMGHVDHGKTTLLDSIRNTNVVENEDGRITQNIGAYQVKWNDNLITFIDTPGHESFSSMRARGANVTDIVILVVAADDGLKPQTEEAIDHALFAKVPIIIFVNKMDKPNPNIDRIISQLADKNVLVEEWGGNYTMIKGSALTKDGIDKLLEAIVLTSDLMNLKANKNRLATGVTIESELDKGMGPIASLLVQNGTLMVGDYILVGEHYGKIRKMINDKNEEVNQALPSTPIKISGLNGVPKAGDKWVVAKDEKTIKDLANKRKTNATRKRNINIIKNSNDDNDDKELNIIIKSDVHGSLEAIKSVLDSINVAGAKINIIRSSVGLPSETDINLARTANAIIFLFKLKPTSQIVDMAKSVDVEIKSYSIIYEIKDSIEKKLKGSLDPVFVEEKVGEVEIRQLWSHSSVGTIAGCKVLSGEISRNCLIRLNRKKELIIENKKIISLKHGKDSVSNVQAGKECGFTVDNFNEFIVGDIVEIYKMVEKKDE